jgi:hypothetical protein
VSKILVVLLGMSVALPCIAQESSSQQAFALATGAQENGAAPASSTKSGVQTLGTTSSDVAARGTTQNNEAGGAIIGVYGGGGKVGEGGVYTGIYDTGTLRHPEGIGLMLELGVAGRTPAKTVDGVLALNMQQVFITDRHPSDLSKHHAFLFLNGGYTRFFLTGNAADYGGGVIWRLPSTPQEFKETRFEYREYYVAGYGRQQEVRISWEIGGDEE